MDKGVYCLVFRNPACMVTVGALGETVFSDGWHIYVGSALGSGGLARLERHIALAEKKDKRPKWHVDWLLAGQDFVLKYAIFAPTTLRLECLIATAFGDGGVPGFGCSDCGCSAHLLYRKTDPAQEIKGVFRSLQLVPVTKTIKNP
jgi:Uri superfamily endonuclease